MLETLTGLVVITVGGLIHGVQHVSSYVYRGRRLVVACAVLLWWVRVDMLSLALVRDCCETLLRDCFPFVFDGSVSGSGSRSKTK